MSGNSTFGTAGYSVMDEGQLVALSDRALLVR